MGVLTGSTSVKPMLSQRLMPTTAASMVLVLTDMAVDSMATVDTLPTHTPMAMDTQLLTAMVLTGTTSERLMPSTQVFTDMDTHLMDTGHTDTGHMLDMLPHTPMATATQQLTLTDIIKLCQ